MSVEPGRCARRGCGAPRQGVATLEVWPKGAKARGLPPMIGTQVQVELCAMHGHDLVLADLVVTEEQWHVVDLVCRKVYHDQPADREGARAVFMVDAPIGAGES